MGSQDIAHTFMIANWYWIQRLDLHNVNIIVNILDLQLSVYINSMFLPLFSS